MSEPTDQNAPREMPKGYVDVEALTDEDEAILDEIWATVTDDEIEASVRWLEEQRQQDEKEQGAQ